MITIHTDERRQTLEGFGASGAWWAQEVGGWADEHRVRVADLLFDRDAGIGLSVYRYNVGAGGGLEIADPWRRAETFEVARSEYDWGRDANARWFLRAARDRGVEHFVAFANSPTARMTRSGLVSGGADGEPNLRPNMHEDFARYLVDVVRHLREGEGVPVGWVSPINEPQWDWQAGKGQEGCRYTPDECVRLTRALLERLEAAGLEVEVSVVESGEWKDTARFSDALLEDPAVGPQLQTFAVHSYWSTREDKVRFVERFRERYPRVRLWMSEWTEMRQGVDRGMGSALELARVVHEDLTVAGVTSWQYWIAVSKYDYRDGLVYVDPAARTVTQTKRLWALGHYSRFVRPGWVRVEAVSDRLELKVSAFLEPVPGALVAVVVNDGPDEVTAPIAFEAPSLEASGLEVFVTSDACDLERSTSTDLGAATIRFGARSIATLKIGGTPC